MLNRGLEPTIVYSNDNHRLTLSYFKGIAKFASLAFMWENVIMIDYLEFIAGCDLEVG